nr:glycylpeptide n-tetradecanoyltransferase [Quercus suber]
MSDDKLASGASLASDVANKSLESSTATSRMADEAAGGANTDVGEDENEADDDGEEMAEGGTAALSTAPKKKKKKPKKKKKANVDAPAVSEQPDQELAGTTAQKPVSITDVEALMKQLSMAQRSNKEGKAPEDYKFWNTQPVPKFREPNLLQTTSGSKLPEGSILPDEVCKASAKDVPEGLVEGFEWCLVDVDEKDELQELYDLLYNHYVEDHDGSFRFNYSPQFLTWALKVPGWKAEWHIGVRARSTQEGKKGKLVAFIAGVPVKLKVRQNVVNAVEINFLTIHRKLRSKRLAPVLIKEVTRRCYRNGIYQALYTAGTLLPTPVSTCRYFHRSLDWEHLYKTGFSHIPNGSSELRQKYKYRLDSQTATKGLRAMKPADVAAVTKLISKYNERYGLRQDFNEEDIEHLLCSKASKDVVWSNVVEQDGKITDIISYYLLENALLQPRLEQLVHDALILAKKDNFHVFNALTLMDNPLFLKDQKFEPGDGKLYYYLFNWRTALLPGGVDDGMAIDETKMGGVGVVML